MNGAHWTDRLSEYLDGEMPERDRAALEAHVAGCAECAATLEALRAVVAEARGLTVPPVPADLEAALWAGIAPRLRPRRRWFGGLAAAFASAPGAGGRRFALSAPQLAAAALAVAVVSGSTVWWIAGRGGARPGPDAPPIAGAPPPVVPAAGDGLPAGFDGTRYAAAVADLEATLAAHRSELDPETLRILEANLEIIDRAVEQARRALLADPANPYLNGHLAGQMRWKLRVLQRATMTLAVNG